MDYADFPKICIAISNKRSCIFSTKQWNIFHNILIAILVVYTLFTIFFSIFACKPIPASFNTEFRGRHPDAKCLNYNKQWNALLWVHMITNFILLCVPILVVIRYSLGFALRLRYFLMIILGSVYCIATVFGNYYPYPAALDPPWDLLPHAFVWHLLQVVLAITLASLPVLNVLFRQPVDTPKKYQIDPKVLYTSNRRSKKPRFIQTQDGVVKVEVSYEISYSQARSESGTDLGLQYPEAALDQPPRRSYGYHRQPTETNTVSMDSSDTASVESKSWFYLNDYDFKALQSRQKFDVISGQPPKTIVHSPQNWRDESSGPSPHISLSLTGTSTTGKTSDNIERIKPV